MTCPRFFAVLILVFVPRPVGAQADTFLEDARALAAAAIQPEPARAAAIDGLVPRLAAALSAWDANIKTLEAQVNHNADGTNSPKSAQSHAELGLIYRARGRYADALREFEAASALQPSSSSLQLLRALTLDSAGQTDAAARAFRLAWTLEPANPVNAYFLLERAAGALQDDTRDRARTVIVDAYRSLLSQSTRGDHPPFVILDGLPDTLSSTPVVGDARTGPGFALLASGKYSEGIAWLSQDHQGQAGGDASTTHFAQAQIAEAENRVSDARREYAAALNGTLAGRSPIYVAIGRLAQVEGDLPAATDALTRAVQLNPNDATMRQELATAYAAQGRTEDAFVELVAGLLVDPANASLHAAVGQLRLDSGHPDEAVPSFVRALDLNPSRYEVRYALATALTRLGRTDEARRQLEIFDRVRRQMLEQRRQGIQNDVEKEDSIRRGLPNPGGNR